MNLLGKKCGLRWFFISAVLVIVIFPLNALGMGMEVITEGMTDYSLERQLNNYIPLDSDFTVFICIGWTADKITVKLTDEKDYGDRLAAIALVYYPQLGQIYPLWGTLYSKESEDSFTITIPSGPPGIVVFLTTGYFSPSVGGNPYKYSINISFPQ